MPIIWKTDPMNNSAAAMQEVVTALLQAKDPVAVTECSVRMAYVTEAIAQAQANQLTAPLKKSIDELQFTVGGKGTPVVSTPEQNQFSQTGTIQPAEDAQPKQTD